MMFGNTLHGQKALITGGAKRLGAAMAQSLAQCGVHVVLHYNHSREAAEKLAAEIKANGGEAVYLHADLSVTSTVEGLLDAAAPVDILINNASIFDDTTFADASPEAIYENMTINAVAPLLLARRFAAQGREGAIINLLDTMVMDYDKKHLPYHLSKRALHALTKIMALEFAPQIRVNAVAPGLILPPPGKDAAYLESLAHTNPLCCHGDPKDVVEAVLYLLTAKFVTGQTLFVDGGRNLKGRMYE